MPGTPSVVGDWNENRDGAARTERRELHHLVNSVGRREFLPGVGRLERTRHGLSLSDGLGRGR